MPTILRKIMIILELNNFYIEMALDQKYQFKSNWLRYYLVEFQHNIIYLYVNFKKTANFILFFGIFCQLQILRIFVIDLLQKYIL